MDLPLADETCWNGKEGWVSKNKQHDVMVVKNSDEAVIRGVL